MLGDCPFCNPGPGRVFLENDLVYALWDGFPVSPGHTLIIPRRHVADWFNATKEEQTAIIKMIDATKLVVEKHQKPDGYNIGINCGEAAGQTVFHLHVHLIPRYQGDVEDPRGGVRCVRPDRAKYWDHQEK